MVHASCYGNPLVKPIPEGDWYCVKVVEEERKDVLLLFVYINRWGR